MFSKIKTVVSKKNISGFEFQKNIANKNIDKLICIEKRFITNRAFFNFFLTVHFFCLSLNKDAQVHVQILLKKILFLMEWKRIISKPTLLLYFYDFIIIDNKIW